jgi:hypothetical protein
LEVSVTQQYIVGQFSVLLKDVQPPAGEWLAAVRELRHEVEWWGRRRGGALAGVRLASEPVCR